MINGGRIMAGEHVRLLASLAVVAVLALGALIVTVPEADASYENPPDPRNIYIASESLDSSTRYPGDQDVMFYVRVRNGPGDELTDDNPIEHCNASIGNLVCDEKGNVVDSPILNWDTQELYDDARIYEGNYYYFQYFQFDLKPDCKPMTYNLTFNIRYQTSGGVIAVFTGYLHFDVSSRVTVNKVTGLYAGDSNREFSVSTYISSSVRDARLVLETPDPDFSWFGTADRFMSAQREGSTGGYWYPYYTISVSKDKAPGTYKTTWTFQWKNSDDIVCTERGQVEFEVGGVPMIGADLYDNVVQQGAHDASLTLHLKNDGTVNLYEVSVSIASPSRTYFRPRADHYEGTSPIGTTRFYIGSVLLQESASVTMDLVVDPRTPAGEHKVLLDLRGVFYDPIAGTYRSIVMDWSYGSDGYYTILDVGPETLYLVPEQSDFVGPSFTVKVEDPAVDIELRCLSDVCAGRLLCDGVVEVQVRNNGRVTYGNVAVRLPTNRDTSPFMCRSDPKSGLSEAGTITTTLEAGDWEVVEVPIRLKEGVTPGPFRIQAEVYAVDLDMGEPMTTEVPILVNVRGSGPLLQVTDVEPTEIEAGEDFTLRLIITNVGDETATEVMLGRPAVDAVVAGATSGGTSDLDGDTAPPEPLFLPVRMQDIPPADWVSIDLQMRSNPDMAPGRVFKLQFCLEYLDPYGDRPDSADQVQEVSVKSKGERGSVQADLYSSVDTVIWLLALGFLVIVVVVSVVQLSAMQSRRAAARRERGREGAPPATPEAQSAPQPEQLPQTQVYDPAQQQQAQQYQQQQQQYQQPQQQPQYDQPQQQPPQQQEGVQSGYGQPPQQ